MDAEGEIIALLVGEGDVLAGDLDRPAGLGAERLVVAEFLLNNLLFRRFSAACQGQHGQ